VGARRPGRGRGPRPGPAPRPKYSREDLALVMAQTGATEDEARAALDVCEGEVAEAIIRLMG